jgi:hypothetical protein
MERFPLRLQQIIINSIWCLLVLVGTTGATGIFPVGQPEYQYFYDLNRRFEAVTPDRLDYQLGPYPTDRLKCRLGPFEKWRTIPDNQLQLFLFAEEDFRAVKDNRNRALESIRGGLVGQPWKRVSVYADFVLDEKLARDPDYTGKKWRGLAGDIDQAYVAWTDRRLTAMVGRFGGFWGVRESLLFSPDQKLDGLTYSFRWGRLAVSYRLGSLDGLHPDNHDGDLFEPRYIAAHRFDFHFSPQLRVGLFETVVFGGPGRQIDLFYLNPLIFFHGSQLNDDLNDNTMVGFDFDLNPTAGVQVYAQVLVDDIQLDNQSQGDKEPDQIGVVAGGYMTDIMTQTDLEFQYQRVTNWTFNQMHERNRYLNDGSPIGSVLGNDYDLISLKLTRWFEEQFALSLNFSSIRRGEGRIDAEFTQPWIAASGDYSEPFPTGVVWKTATASVGLRGFLSEFGFVDLEAGVQNVKNFDNVAGDDRTLPFVRIYLSGFLMSGFGLE